MKAAAALLILTMAGSLRASPQEPNNFREEVRVTLRLIDFLALDRKDRPITDLGSSEVRLWEDGEQKAILSLLPSYESPLPPDAAQPGADTAPPQGATLRTEASGRRWIVFLIAARDLSRQSRILAAGALADLVKKELTPTDRVSLMVDADELRILVPFTTGREILLRHLERPDALSESARDQERRLSDLRDNAASCRDTSDVAGCARQAAGTFVAETGRETETSLDHLETLVKSLGSIPDRKILLYVSDGLILNPGDVGMAAVEHAIGQYGYSPSAMRSLLTRDYGPRLETLYQLAVDARVGFYPVSGIRKMTDEAFSVERTQDYGPENPPQARTDPFEATWEQVRDLHEGLAGATGGVALFRRDPKGLLGDLLRAAGGSYTIAYAPTEPTAQDRKIRIEIARPGARAIHRKIYRSVPQDQARDLPGDLVVEEASYDLATRRVRAKLRVAGGAFATAESADPEALLISLFFEVRDLSNHPVQDLHQIISIPRDPADTHAGDLVYPFVLQVPPGPYLLRVTLRDLNGPARGMYQRSFSVPAAAARTPSSADSPRQ